MFEKYVYAKPMDQSVVPDVTGGNLDVMLFKYTLTLFVTKIKTDFCIKHSRKI